MEMVKWRRKEKWCRIRKRRQRQEKIGRNRAGVRVRLMEEEEDG